ncbi:unnamed protein product, partial [Callosobruchus maculatus]
MYYALGNVIVELLTPLIEVMTESEETNITPEFPAKRLIKRIRDFEYENEDEAVRDAKESYKISFYFTVLDRILMSIEESCIYDFFETQHYELRKCTVDLDLKLRIRRNEEIEQDVDGNQLYTEALMFKEIFPRLVALKGPIKNFWNRRYHHLLAKDVYISEGAYNLHFRQQFVTPDSTSPFTHHSSYLEISMICEKHQSFRLCIHETCYSGSSIC